MHQHHRRWPQSAILTHNHTTHTHTKRKKSEYIFIVYRCACASFSAFFHSIGSPFFVWIFANEQKISWRGREREKKWDSRKQRENNKQTKVYPNKNNSAHQKRRRRRADLMNSMRCSFLFSVRFDCWTLFTFFSLSTFHPFCLFVVRSFLRLHQQTK